MTISSMNSKDYIRKVVYAVIVDNNISSYPINIFSIYKNMENCRVVSYSKYMKKNKLTAQQVIDFCESEEGCTMIDSSKTRYMVLYNDLNEPYKSPQRILWTLAHELGHICLNHLHLINCNRISRKCINESKYKQFEAQANYFASILLANPVILNEFNLVSVDEIMKKCNISKEAANYRYEYFIKWKFDGEKTNEDDKFILKQFNNYISTVHCEKCNTKYSKNYFYCPICGTKENNNFKGGNYMKYNSINLNINSKAICCPICENEIDNYSNGEFCKICGNHITNKCTNASCNAFLDGSSRFCPYCGNESTFYHNNLLQPYTNNTIAITNNYDEYGDMPF